MTDNPTAIETEQRVIYDPAAPSRLATAVKRPNGGPLLIGGALAFVAGIILVFIGILMPAISDPGSAGIGDLVAAVPPTYNEWKWPLVYLGSTLCSLSVLVLSLGVVVRAMFFLPGREVQIREIYPNG